MLFSHTFTSSPNSLYNLHIQPAPADIAPYFDPQPLSKATPLDNFSPSSSSTEKTEGHSPFDTDSDCGLGQTSESLQRLSMAEERREGNEQDKGKGKDTSRNTSPSGSSSQGDMADNEMEAAPSQPTSEPTEAPPPPKKKRTRTLTTPHQAAVLHALLAQSRFPTTAMREEVGRAIGLSARKVQIWFQNQRQKARRPRGQNVPPLTRPPQYGPFPSASSGFAQGEYGIATEVSLAESSHTAHTRGASFSSRGVDLDPAWRELHSPEGQQRAGFTSQLSGPGIPGSATGPSSPESLRDVAHAPAENIRPRTSHFSPGPRRHTITRPWTSEQREQLHSVPRPSSSALRHSTDFSMSLPPLRLSRPRSRTFTGRGASHASPSSPRGGPLSSPTRLPPLRTDTPSVSEAPLRIPPPFTLQPRPLWDDPSFSPYRRPSPHIAQQSTMASHEFITLPPPSGHEGNPTQSPAHFSAATSPLATSSYRPTSPLQHSLPGPSSWTVRRPDDDNSSRDYDVTR